jgi:hypothetical protein
LTAAQSSDISTAFHCIINCIKRRKADSGRIITENVLSGLQTYLKLKQRLDAPSKSICVLIGNHEKNRSR